MIGSYKKQSKSTFCGKIIVLPVELLSPPISASVESVVSEPTFSQPGPADGPLAKFAHVVCMYRLNCDSSSVGVTFSGAEKDPKTNGISAV